MREFAFRPIEHWPPEFSRTRNFSDPFRAGYSDTLELLDRELSRLSAWRVVIQLALSESDLRRDGLPRAHAVPRHPGVIVSFDSKHGPLRYGTDAFPHWQSNLRAIALGLEALRKVDRYGIGKRGEQYAGWKQLEAGGENLRARGARLIDEHGGVAAALKATHPDLDGDPDDFRAVMAARLAA
jgi:hypothetical protein